MQSFEINILLFKTKIMFKSHKIKSDHRAPRKNKVDAYEATAFAPDIALLFKQPKCVLSPITVILCILHFYGCATLIGCYHKYWTRTIIIKRDPNLYLIKQNLIYKVESVFVCLCVCVCPE